MAARRLPFPTLMMLLFGAGYLFGQMGARESSLQAAPSPVALAESDGRVFELRTYTAPDGKLDELLARFRDHTLRIFEKHGMTNVGYWTPQDEPLSKNTLIYVLAHASRDAAERSWQTFRSDPEWQRVAEESQRDGEIVANVERLFLEPADFSPMQ